MKWKKQIIVAIFLFLIILTSMYIYRLGIIDKIRSKMFVISYDNGDNQYEKIIKIVSLSLTLSLLFSLISLAQEEAPSSKTEEFYFNDTSDFIVKNADNLDKTEYYKDAIAIDHRVSDLFMNSNTLAAVSEKCDVSLGIHHNNSRGVWLSVLIEPQKKIPETILTSANGKWIHAFNGGAGITSYFTQPASYPKWTMLIEKDLGKKPAGTQIYAHVSVSATMSYGYMPTTMRTAIATVK